jgi:hypothetical protein
MGQPKPRNGAKTGSRKASQDSCRWDVGTELLSKPSTEGRFFAVEVDAIVEFVGGAAVVGTRSTARPCPPAMERLDVSAAIGAVGPEAPA